MKLDLKLWLRRSTGQELNRVRGEYHQDVEGHTDKKPMFVWMTFSGIEEVCIAGASDGWHILAKERPIDPLDMAEHGRTLIRDMSGVFPFDCSVGHSLESVSLIVSPTPDSIIGFQMEFGSDRSAVVLNWGDELFLGDGNDWPDDWGSDPDPIQVIPL